MLRSLFALLLLGFISPSLSFASTEKASCEELLIDEATRATGQLMQYLEQTQNGGKASQSEQQAIFNVADFIAKKKALPTTLEMPGLLGGAAVKKAFTGLPRRLQNQIREEMLVDALSKYTESQQAIKAHLGSVVLKQFSQNYTIPSFVDLAKKLNSTGAEVARLFYPEQGSTKVAYEVLLEEVKEQNATEFNKIRVRIIRLYAQRARAIGRTPELNEFYTFFREKNLNKLTDAFTLNHLAYILGEPEQAGAAIEKPYVNFFESMENLFAEARQMKPSDFTKVVDRYAHNAQSQAAILEDLRNKDRVIVSFASPGVDVHEEAFVTMLKIAEEKDATIIFFPEAGQPMDLDPAILSHPRIHIIYDDIEATPWLQFNVMPVMAKRVDPLSPVRAPSRGGTRQQTQIIGHPQLRDEIQGTVDNHLTPRRLVTTGSLVKPWYSSSKLIGGVTDRQARDVHMVAFTMLEKDRSDSGLDGLGTAGTYHVQQYEWSDHSKSFKYNGKKYSLRPDYQQTNYRLNGKEDYELQLQQAGIQSGDETENHEQLLRHYEGMNLVVEDIRPEHYIPGDKHIGGEDHADFAALEASVIRKYRPKHLIVHDGIDLNSISHWDAKDMVLMAEKARRGELDLQAELDKFVAYINQVLLLDDEIKVLIVESNHNNWINRLLSEINRAGSYGNQPGNDPLIQELLHAKMNMGIDPLDYYLLYRYDTIMKDPQRRAYAGSVTRLVDPERVVFMQKGDSLKVGPADATVEIGEHGHNGPGFRGPGVTLQTSAGRAYNGIVFGHTHSPGRNGRGGNVGASIGPRQAYALGGASSVAMGFGFLYADGIFNINVFNTSSKTYTLGDGKPLPAEEFFPKDPTSGIQWPRHIPDEVAGRNVETRDQWGRGGRFGDRD